GGARTRDADGEAARPRGGVPRGSAHGAAVAGRAGGALPRGGSREPVGRRGGRARHLRRAERGEVSRIARTPISEGDALAGAGCGRARPIFLALVRRKSPTHS